MLNNSDTYSLIKKFQDQIFLQVMTIFTKKGSIVISVQ